MSTYNMVVLSHVITVCSPLVVVENKTGKKRLVINLKYLNRFKYEDMRTALMYFDEGGYTLSPATTM